MNGETPEDVSLQHEENREAWNEAARRYEMEVEQDIAFIRTGQTNFHALELPILQHLCQDCRRAVHLQCAGGTETLYLWILGADEVIGVDISDRMIECARRKSEALGAPATWHRCDVFDTPHELDGTVDLIYTGKGALVWIMDLDAWAGVVARLLRPGGTLFVFDGHPLTWVWDNQAADYRLDPTYGDYFSETVAVSEEWPEQYIPPSVAAPARKNERQWNIGQILNSLVGAGLTLERFEEHPDPYWDQFPNLTEEVSRKLPQTFSLIMRKEDRSLTEPL